MISVRRLLAVGALLALAVASTSSQVWGEPNPREQELEKWRSSSKTEPPLERPFADERLPSRFAGQPLGLYRSTKGETYFFLQLKPELPKAAPRPRDYVVVIDTSASKAQGPLAIAKGLAEALALQLRPEDRLSLWTVSNGAHNLTDGLVAFRDLKEARPEKPGDAKAPRKDVFRRLDEEYPSGAVDLKNGLTKAVADFNKSGPGRHRVLLFLGDGKSLAGPVDADDRAALCDEMVKRQVAFFSVPLGTRLDPQNLHGFASGTGGACVRLEAGEKFDDFLKRLGAAFDVPVLYPHTFKLPAEVTEFFPARLPPLRADAPTLLVGKMRKPAGALRYTLAGTAAGQDVRPPDAELKVPPADDDNFFLVNMVAQWHGRPDRPALIRADRALAYACERNQLARADLLARADMALDQDKFDVARQLFEQALQVDPHSADAKGGARVAERLQLELEKRAGQEKAKGQGGKDRKALAEELRQEMRGQFEAKPGDPVTRISHGVLVKRLS